MSSAYDYGSGDENGFKFETMAFELIKNDQSGQGLLIAMLLCGEETKKVLLREYIDKFISTKNPIHTLLMIKISKVRNHTT
jgi:hypothetical protein